MQFAKYFINGDTWTGATLRSCDFSRIRRVQESNEAVNSAAELLFVIRIRIPIVIQIVIRIRIRITNCNLIFVLILITFKFLH